MGKIILLMLLLASGPLVADCMRESSGLSVCGQGPCAKNLRGQVFCARHRYGAALRDSRGNVVCGLGQCEKNLHGAIYCASEPGGSAIRNRRGEIECPGGCRPADMQFCERVLAEP